jgi:hypothetical protein
VPKETWANEKRIALTPAATAMLVKKAIRRAAAHAYSNLTFCEDFQPLSLKIVKKVQTYLWRRFFLTLNPARNV